MSLLSGFPYCEVEFTKEGSVRDPGAVSSARTLLDSENVTDLVVISHGWNNDETEARAFYRGFVGALRTELEGAHAPESGGRVVAVLGVLWPSKKFADTDLVAGGAAAVDTGPGDAEISAALDQLVAALDDPEAARKLERAKGLIPALGGDPAARRRFADTLRSTLPASAADDQDLPGSFLRLPGEEVFDRLAKPLPTEVVHPATPDAGGVVEVGEVLQPPDGGGAFLGEFFSGVKAAALKLANVSTYYVMKERAGLVGRAGVCPVLRDLAAHRGGLKIHLVGHSFGGRLVAAAAAACVDAPRVEIASLTLLQAAFSHHGFAENFDGSRDGFFRRVVSERIVQGPVLVTHTRNDTAVGYLYPVASLLAGDDAAELGDANDRFGGIGRNGAQRTPEARNGSLQDVDGTYAFTGAALFNLEGSRFIADHGSVVGPQIAHAFAHAMVVG